MNALFEIEQCADPVDFVIGIIERIQVRMNTDSFEKNENILDQLFMAKSYINGLRAAERDSLTEILHKRNLLSPILDLVSADSRFENDIVEEALWILIAIFSGHFTIIDKIFSLSILKILMSQIRNDSMEVLDNVT